MNDLETLHPDRSKWQADPRNSSVLNSVLPKVFGDMSNNGRSDVLVGRALNIIFGKLERQNRAYWLEKFEHYKALPRGKEVKYKKIPTADNFITKTAGELLQNPQDINFMQDALISKGDNATTQDPKQQFVKLVKDNCLTLIKDNWIDVKPGQLSNLVRIYSNDNDLSQDFAKKMLAEYFKGSSDKLDNSYSRVIAFYKFLSATLDLIGEDEAFREAMKIVLYSTEDILPKDPGLIEQRNLLSMPSEIEEKRDEFKKLLIMEHVTKQVIALSSQDFTKYIRANMKYLMTETKPLNARLKRKKRAEAERGPIGVQKKNLQIRAAIDVLLNISRLPWSEEGIEKLRKMDQLYEKAFDPSDPLNQKLKRVLSENRSRSGINAQSRLEEVASIK